MRSIAGRAGVGRSFAPAMVWVVAVALLAHADDGARAQTTPESVPRAPAPAPARGPADLIRRARADASQRSLENAAVNRAPIAAGSPLPVQPAEAAPESGTAPPRAVSAAVPAGTPSPGDAETADAAEPTQEAPHPTAANPRAANPHAANPHGLPQPISVEAENAELAAGTLRVRVVDENAAPVAGADVRVAILASEGDRSERTARTDAGGEATFTALAVGEKQAYRVTVPHEGARYGSMPFRLSPRGGYDVTVRRLPVTHDDARIVLYLGATSIELRDERMSIVQQARLVNLDARTYVFPEGGTLVRLPPGFTAFQSQESMGDQRVRQSAGEGARVEGSIPPGEAVLLWGFELPIEGSEMRFGVEIPWKAFAYRVVADAAPGLDLSVEPMPRPWTHEDGGRRFLVTEIQRKVGERPFTRLRLTITGIPGPGPLRWMAAVLALGALGVASFVARRPPPATADAEATGAQRKDILARARELEAARRSGEIGPAHHAEQSAVLVDSLAAVLAAEDARRSPPSPRGG